MASLTPRSEQFHLSLAWTMLHNAIIGAVSIEHPYFKAFLEGLKLPCKNSFNLSEIAHSYLGEVSGFVVDLMSATIKSFQDLRLIVREDISEGEKRALNDAFSASGPQYQDASFSALFQEFLEGVGAPSAGMLDAVKDRYEPSVASTLENLNQPAYRMKMFCWAASGAPRVMPDEDPIKASACFLLHFLL
ncbi:hypothetical protein BT96DRAFT_823986 [Gymnopus androsaceus JB14]|uniref:Uncharacterized protein n=1 Tax=Gymnopus androsaceus JB14 TaxID=1447944 RepID=A0A6A4HEQ5_9AGAR|nr:hypothetical protein BT96DRAFT_823986 [Gymnopus androsaceus JB14]